MPPKRMGSGSQIRGGRPAVRSGSASRRPAVVRSPRRSASPQRVQTRTVKRTHSRQQAQRVNPRPRPVVRPASVPKKRMPAPSVGARPRLTPRNTTSPAPRAGSRPAPAANRPQVRRAVRPARAVVRPATSRAIKRGAAQAVGMAATAAAVNRLVRLNTTAAAPAVMYQVNSIQSSLDQLESRADMSEVRADIANLDANLNHAVSLLESAREKGYYYQSDLEDIAYDAMSRWHAVRDEVNAGIDRQASEAANYYQPVNQHIHRLNNVIGSINESDALFAETEREIDTALRSVEDAEQAIEAIYDDIEQLASQLTIRLTRIHWVLTQRDQASFDFMEDEEIYMAVKARWDQLGEDDPEGVLFLTTQRLIFEQKEKIATKKVLFVATAKELVQKVLGAQPLKGIANIKAQGKGLFAHQDYLEVDFGSHLVPFHLDGQNSEDWVVWIQQAKSGKLAEDRTTGSKLSFADLSGNLTQGDILDVQNEVNEIQDELMLKGIQSELSELENRVSNLSRELVELRARGYLVEKSLEADVEVLILQWEKIKERANTTLTFQTNSLGGEMEKIKAAMAKLAGMSGSLTAARPFYVNLKSMIASAEAQAEAAEETVLDQYDEYAEEVETLDAHFEWVDWMLDAIDTASFKLLATESGVAAVEAIWERPGQDPLNGVLFLTDQRILWEERVDDFELMIENALDEVQDVSTRLDDEDGGQRLMVRLSGGAPVSDAVFLFSQPVVDVWLEMIGRARSGGYGSDRAVEIDPQMLDRIRKAPSKCPNCGAAFTSPVLRGQDEIVCEFCGVSTRI
ncbi:MAG: hypothetical protein JW757_10865 [Anaerolineales bacterium]|nr:hypothetical protein [Anaerolineales bacterium]